MRSDTPRSSPQTAAGGAIPMPDAPILCSPKYRGVDRCRCPSPPDAPYKSAGTALLRPMCPRVHDPLAAAADHRSPLSPSPKALEQSHISGFGLTPPLDSTLFSRPCRARILHKQIPLSASMSLSGHLHPSASPVCFAPASLRFDDSFLPLDVTSRLPRRLPCAPLSPPRSVKSASPFKRRIDLYQN